MKILHNGIEKESRQDKKGRWIVDNRTLVSIDGIKFENGFGFPEPTYTREQLLAMTVAELDAVEAEIGNIDGYYSMLKADKQTAILDALVL